MEGVDGYLVTPQARMLEKYSVGCVVMEIGSFVGRSAVAMAPAAKQIICIDHWRRPQGLKPEMRKYDDGGKLILPGKDPVALPQFLRNVAHWRHKIVPVVMDSADAVKLDWWPPLDMLFIDGGHDYESVSSDLGFLRFLKPGGILAMHDVTAAGVSRAIAESEVVDWKVLEKSKKIGSLVIYRKPGDS